jgi:Recombination endonuclease VII
MHRSFPTIAQHLEASRPLKSNDKKEKRVKLSFVVENQTNAIWRKTATLARILSFPHYLSIGRRTGSGGDMIMRGHNSTVEELRSVLDYDPDTGEFTWKVRVADCANAGSPAGTPSRNGQRQIVYRYRVYAASQLAWALHTGAFPRGRIFYKDGNSSNLRFVNLRDSGGSQLDLPLLEAARELLDYDPQTGVFKWRVKGTRKNSGTVLQPKGKNYRSIKINGCQYMAQRIAWLLVYGDLPEGQIEPLNGDVGDFRINNWVIRRQPIEEKKAKKSEHYKRWRAANPDKIRHNSLMHYFGIDNEQYAKMLVAQGGVCAICDRPERMIRFGKVQALSVDHDHKTGDLRSLLCHACNKALGAFGDDPARLERAAAYLRHHAASAAPEKEAA